MIKQVICERVPIKIWTNDIDDNTINQLKDVSKLPFIHKHVAVMPDAHMGKGSTIGSVIPTINAIIPAAVGVDLGCGMSAVKTSLTANDLPDNLRNIRNYIENSVPHGRSNNGGAGDRGGWHNIPDEVSKIWMKHFHDWYNDVLSKKHPKAISKNTLNHLGTLGTGNHFIEICLDENDDVWIMLHSGSRGLGNRIGSYFIDKAKEEMERYHISEYLPNSDLSYLVSDTKIFDDYMDSIMFAQEFAHMNRMIMMSNVMKVMEKFFPPYIDITNVVVDCHHNYVSIENHFNKNVYVTRKGAISAKEEEFGIIPGSMGDKSYIVKGLGNQESFCSCSHGAGRRMGRNEAKRIFTVEDLKKQTEGIECPKDEARIDEIPAAYKPIDSVMDNQRDLVEIVHTLKQVVNVKG